MFTQVREMMEGIVNKPDGYSDLSQEAFLGEIVNNDLLLQSIDKTIKDISWYQAMNLENNSLFEKKVWELVENKGIEPTGSRSHFAFNFRSEHGDNRAWGQVRNKRV